MTLATKVAVLCTATQVQQMFAPEVWQQLAARVELVGPPTNRPDESEARRLLSGAQVCIVSWGSPRFTAELLAAAPDLRLIIYAAGSIKPVVSDAVYERGITITSGAHVIGRDVAATALGLIIVAMKGIFPIARAGGWQSKLARSITKDMYNTTVGIVGAGHVGRQVLQYLQQFDVRVLLYDPTLSAAQAAEFGAELCDLDSLVAQADVISLHAPSIPATRHMINAERLRRMKDGATLINTARGSLIDEQALIAELQSGRIWAILDVTDPEPPAADSPLFTLPNVIITPHIAGSVTTGLQRLGHYAAAEIDRFLQGLPPINPVRQEQLPYLA